MKLFIQIIQCRFLMTNYAALDHKDDHFADVDRVVANPLQKFRDHKSPHNIMHGAQILTLHPLYCIPKRIAVKFVNGYDRPEPFAGPTQHPNQ